MDTGAETRVVASFTLIAAFLTGGMGAFDYLTYWAFSIPEFGTEPNPWRWILMVALAALPVIVSIVATVVAYQSGKAAETHWARVLGGAGAILGVMTVLIAVGIAVAAYLTY